MVPYDARRTTRLGAMLLLFAVALSGQAGSRLLKRIGMAVSADTLLRLAKQAESVALIQNRGEPHEIRHWALQELAPGDGYSGALAVEGYDWSLSCWQWQDSANA